MIVAINYANDLYKKTQKYCTHSAYKYGVDKVFELADGAFVGTYFKKDGIFENPIDEDRVKNFMDHVHEITSKL